MKASSRPLPFFICIVLLLVALTGCESMGDVFEQASKDIATESIPSGSSSSGSSSGGGALDLKDGELLVAFEGSTRDDSNFLRATTLTAASADTKNEGEFLFVDRGDVKWTPWFFESYIPNQNELKLGLKVFYSNQGMAHFSPIDSKRYQTSWWHIGRITNLDELYKGVVGIDGDSYQVAAIRLPTEPFN